MVTKWATMDATGFQGVHGVSLWGIVQGWVGEWLWVSTSTWSMLGVCLGDVYT